MKSTDDIESFLLRVGLPYEQPKPGLWVIKIDNSENLVISEAGPVLAFRMKVMTIPPHNREELFRKLLALNTTEVVHCAFGLEGDSVVLVQALELENLDWNEFSAVVDEMTMAISKLYGELAQFRTAA